ncbi:hypothetical protein ACT3QR_08110 [Psychrobacter sp. AOP7-B1-25]
MNKKIRTYSGAFKAEAVKKIADNNEGLDKVLIRYYDRCSQYDGDT